jgi:MFS family permease
MLGFIGLVQGVPFILGSFWAGHMVDRREKKRLIQAAIALQVLSTAGLAALSRTAHPPLLLIYLLVAAAALFTSLETPAASSYLQILVPSEIFSKAAAWNLANYVGATVLGPIIGGFLLGRVSPAAVYAIAAALLAAAFVIAAPLRHIPPASVPSGESAVKSVMAGLRFVLNNRIIFAAMVLDSFAVLFGEVVFILPVFAARLGAGPLGLGLLRAAPAVGSCLISFVQAGRPLIRVRWNWLQGAVVLFGLSIIGFGLSPALPLSLLMLVCSGAADGVSVIIRQSLYQMHTPDAYRGRVSSVSGVFISISNEVGGFESGLAAQFLGPVRAAVIGGLIAIAAVAAIRIRYPTLGREAERAA